MTIVLNTLLALPVYAIMPPRAAAVPARRPAPPPAPGLHDRRPQPALARLCRRASRNAARRSRRSSRARRRARRLRVRAVRDRLLPPLVPAGADRRGLRLPGAREPRAQGPHRGAARRHRRPQRRQARRARKVAAGRADATRRRCPRRVLGARPTTTARRCAAAERARLAAGTSCNALEPPAARATAASTTKRPARASAASCAEPPARRRAGAGPAAAAATRPSCAALYKPPRPRDAASRPNTIHNRVIRGIADAPYSNVTIRTDVPRAAVQLHARARRAGSPASSSRSATCASTRTQAGRPAVRHASSRSAAAAQGEAYRASRRARGSARAASRRHYDRYLRGKDGYQRVVVNALGQPRRPAQTDVGQGAAARASG